MPEGLGDLQSFKAPGPKLLLAQALRQASALGVVAVTMPCIDTIKSAAKATVRDGNPDDEWKLTLSNAGSRFLDSHWTGHGSTAPTE
jgi:hypothetical protein